MAYDSRRSRKRSVLQVSFYYDGDFYGTECFTQRRLVIGRGPDADIRIECDLISRVHAVLRIVGESVIVEDLSSRNGIRVNNQAVKRAPLGNWDSLALGAYLLKFHLLSYGTRLPTSQLEVLQLPSDPDWESTDEVTALPLQLEAEPTFDMPMSLLPPVARLPEPEDRVLEAPEACCKLFPMADMLEPDPYDTIPELPVVRHGQPEKPAARAEIVNVERLTNTLITKVSLAPGRRLSQATSRPPRKIVQVIAQTG
jgi:predicted component of type VI protein secretion system